MEDRTTQLLSLSLSTLLKTPIEPLGPIEASRQISQSTASLSLFPCISQVYTLPVDRLTQDRFWVLLYGVVMSVWLVLALAAGWTVVIPGSFLRGFEVSMSTLMVWMTLALLGGFLWMYLLSHFAGQVIKVTAFGVPTLMLSASVYTLIHTSIHVFTMNESLAFELSLYLGSSIGGILVSLWFFLKIWTRQHLVKTMQLIVQLSCQILKANPRLFVLSANLLLVQIVFTVLWTLLYSRFLMLEYQSYLLNGGTWSWPISWLSSLFLLVFFWTCGVLSQFQKMTVASVTGQWYFHRYDGRSKGDLTAKHAQVVFEKSLGTVILSALIVGIVQLLQAIAKRLNSLTSKSSTSILSKAFGLVGTLIQDISGYTLIYAGLTGDSFLSCAYDCSRIFKRNMMGYYSLAKILSILGRTFVGFLVSCIVFYSELDSESPTSNIFGSEWVLSGLAGIIAFNTVGLVTKVMDDTVQATFVCYLVDLDTNACHCEGAHRIFSK